MKLGLYLKLAWRNLKTNQQLQVPFVLASSIMFACVYIMASLGKNQYVLERHQQLPVLMNLGMIIVTLLAVIFTIYGQTFIAKRRSKEFSLYSILGFEKAHISMVILVEQFINFLMIGLFSVMTGQFVGTVMFKVMSNLLKDAQSTLGDYPVSYFAIGWVLTVLAVTLIVLYLFQTLRISLLNPMHLMSQQISGEKASKLQPLWLLLGIITLVAGYYIAWTTTGLLNALMMFFVAVLLVMGATYFLFMSLISFVLNRLKQNKNQYYQPSHFLSISGMLYRIRSNAISLASIAILSTGFMLALGSTISIYGAIEESVKLRHTHDYEILSKDHDYFLTDSEDTILTKKVAAESKLSQINELPEVKESFLTERIYVNLLWNKSNQSFEALEENDNFSNDKIFMGTLMTLEDYNKLNGSHHQLQEGEILINDLNHVVDPLDEVKLNNTTYKIKKNSDAIHTNVVIEYVQIVVADREEMMSIGKYYKKNESRVEPGGFIISFDVKKNSATLKDKVEKIFNGTSNNIMDIDSTRKETYQLNGGFLFLGIIIGIVLLVGTVLMIYYKQITEGYDDKANYQIMKQVGLPEEMIKKTIQQQTFWLFALPIIVAVIHGLAASKIIYRLLELFGIYNLAQFFIPYVIVIGIFILIYYLVYRVTSRVYYQIVNEE